MGTTIEAAEEAAFVQDAIEVGVWNFADYEQITEKPIPLTDHQRASTHVAKRPAFWALVEVMGHQSYLGVVEEITFAGREFVQVTTPAVNGHRELAKLIGSQAIFAITPCTEQEARAQLERRYAYRPAALPAYGAGVDHMAEEEFDEGDSIDEASDDLPGEGEKP